MTKLFPAKSSAKFTAKLLAETIVALAILGSGSLFAQAPATAPAAPTVPAVPVVATPPATAIVGNHQELKDYVVKADPSYKFVELWVWRHEKDKCEYAQLALTSQTWRDIAWKHELYIIKPKEVRAGSGAVLLIDGGRWSSDLEEYYDKPPLDPPAAIARFGALAERLQAPVVVLRQVPFQPIFGGLVEDQIIAYTFEQYMRTGDVTWPLLFPMVKAAVRGMDAAQQFSQDKWKINIDHFTVTGASKRGWTTWLTAAVDPRVTALAPMVIDTLNMGPQLVHQLETWGKFSEQLDDYTHRGIQKYSATPAGMRLTSIIDPYAYRDDIKQPKLIILGTNDRYWPLDSLNLYWAGLSGEKHILYVPNNSHGLRDMERVYGTIAALHRSVSGEKKLANLTWERPAAPGKLRLSMKSDQKPATVVAWVAQSPTKDFRDAKWTSVPAQASGEVFECEQPLPTSGYQAMFGEARYELDGAPYFFSTTVEITPAEITPAEITPAAEPDKR